MKRIYTRKDPERSHRKVNAEIEHPKIWREMPSWSMVLDFLWRGKEECKSDPRCARSLRSPILGRSNNSFLAFHRKNNNVKLWVGFDKIALQYLVHLGLLISLASVTGKHYTEPWGPRPTITKRCLINFLCFDVAIQTSSHSGISICSPVKPPIPTDPSTMSTTRVSSDV